MNFNFKPIAVILLGTSLTLSLTSCGNKAETDQHTELTEVVENTEEALDASIEKMDEKRKALLTETKATLKALDKEMKELDRKMSKKADNEAQKKRLEKFKQSYKSKRGKLKKQMDVLENGTEAEIDALLKDVQSGMDELTEFANDTKRAFEKLKD